MPHIKFRFTPATAGIVIVIAFLLSIAILAGVSFLFAWLLSLVIPGLDLWLTFWLTIVAILVIRLATANSR